MAGAIRRLYGEIFLKDKASKSVDKVDFSITRAKRNAEGLQSAMKAVGGAIFLKKTFDVIDNMIGLSGAFEQTNTAFEVMLGSAGKATTMLKEIEDFSLVTPFTPEALTENAKLLLNFGRSAESILPSLNMLGDIAGGDMEKLNRLTLAFSQSASVGRLMGQDLLQMINAGFNPLQVISEKTGKSMRQLKDEMQKGNITFAMVEGAFKTATSEGGKFHNMMQKMSTTWSGLTSTFQGFKGLIFRKVGDVFTTAFKPVLAMINKMLLSFVKFIDTKEGMAILKIAVVALSIAIGVGLVIAIKVAIAAAAALNIALLPITGTIFLVVGALTALFLLVEDIYTFFTGGQSVVGNFFEYIWKDIKKTGKNFLWLYNYVVRLFYRALNFVTSFGMEIIRAIIPIDFFEGLIERIINTFKKLPDKIWNSIKGLYSKVMGWFSGDDAKAKGKPEGKAKGGIVSAGTSYIVGEQGPELFTPGYSGYITPNNNIGSKISVKNIVGSIQITVQNASEGADEIKNVILDALNDLAENIFPAESGIAIT